MAKTLDKIRKEFGKISKDVGMLDSALQSAKMQNQALQLQVYTFAEEAGKVAAKLRINGHKGKTMSDFKSDKSVAEALKLVAARIKTGTAELKQVKANNNKLAETHKALFLMAKELGEEVTKRKKKASRKLFKVQSESLPDLEKLKKEVDKQVKEAEAVFKDFRSFLGDKPFELATRGDDPFSVALKSNPKTKDKFDLSHTYIQNKRAQILYRKRVAKHASDLKKLCTAATKKAEAGESCKAEMDAAAAQYKEVHKIKKIMTTVKTSAEKAVREGKAMKEPKKVKLNTDALDEMKKLLLVEAGMHKLLQDTTKETFKLKKGATVS